MAVQRSAVADVVGPVYDSAAVESLTGWSSADLSQRRTDHRVLAARTGDGTWVYPIEQFEGAEVHPRVLLVLQSLAEFAPGAWTLLSWFCAPEHDRLGGRSPLACLKTDDHESVTVLASETAARWRG